MSESIHDARWVFASGLAHLLTDDDADSVEFVTLCGLSVDSTTPGYAVAPSLDICRSLTGLGGSADRGKGIIEIEVSAVGSSEDEAIVLDQAAVENAISTASGKMRSLLPTSLETSRMAVA